MEQCTSDWRDTSTAIGARAPASTGAATQGRRSSSRTSLCSASSTTNCRSVTTPFHSHFQHRRSFQVSASAKIGSYFLSQNVNIRYPVQAYLVDFKNNKKSHPYAYNVTLMEPPRTALTPTVGSKVTTPNICCCCAQGTTKLDVQFSKNIAKSGESVSLNIHVDNKQCKKKIENVSIQVVQNTFVQSASGANRLWKAVLGESNAPMVREYG